MVSARVKRGTLSASQAEPTWLSGTSEPEPSPPSSGMEPFAWHLPENWLVSTFRADPETPNGLVLEGTPQNPLHNECHPFATTKDWDATGRYRPSGRAKKLMICVTVHDGLSYIPCPVQSQRGGRWRWWRIRHSVGDTRKSCITLC